MVCIRMSASETTKEERLSILRETLEQMGAQTRQQRHSALERLASYDNGEFLEQIYRDACEMPAYQRIRAERWFMIRRVIKYVFPDNYQASKRRASPPVDPNGPSDATAPSGVKFSAPRG